MLPVRLGMARQHQMAPVGGRHMDVDHLQSGELLDDGAWGEAGRLGSGEIFQGHEQAIGDERDEDVRLDARLELVEDGADGKIVLELLERLLDFGELHVVAPQLGGVFTGHVRAQQIAALAPIHLSQLLATQAVGEPVGGQLLVGVRDIDLDEEPRPDRRLSSPRRA